jgi:ABC-type sugar transport system ATPase subunit
MARGWESKSIEAQQAEASEKASTARVRLSPEEAANRRKREVLQLSRQRIAHQLATVQNPQHRKMLEEALAELDRKLNEG